jgi:hypothetical protein
MLATGRDGWTLAVFSGALELLGIVDGVAGAGFECVLPVAGGWAALDLLLLVFAALETEAGAFEAELTVLAVEEVECVLALVPAGCGLELLSAVAGFFIGEDAEFDGDTGCVLAPGALATVADVADVELAAGRTSAAVDNTISTGSAAGGGAAVRDVDAVAAGACAGVTAAAGGAATLLATGAIVGAETDTTLTGAELGATLAEAEAGAGAAAALRACALAAACARLAAIAGVLLLSSSSGGKFGNVLSGTQASTPLAEWIFTKPFTRPTISTVSPHLNFAATSKLPSDSYTHTRS